MSITEKVIGIPSSNLSEMHQKDFVCMEVHVSI